MNKKTNGHNSGAQDKIIHFPSLADRDRLRKQKQQENQSGDAQSVPFFNFSKIPSFTRALAIVFMLVHIPLYLFLDAGDRLAVLYQLGFVPAYFSGVIKPFPLIALASPITHMLIHGSWMHLGFNLVMTLALGTFFERQFGLRFTAIFWLICGLAGALVFFIINPFSTYPVIGASGAISGLFAAIIMVIHRQKELAGQSGRFGPWPLLGFWVAFMIGTGMISGDHVAWQAHIGGFTAGIAVLTLVQKGKIRP